MSNLVGKTIGDYQIIEFVNRGDSSLVYKGFQPDLNRYVAVKVLSPAAARRQARVDAFLGQGQLMRQLDHPNILAVYDADSAKGLTYQASRFIEEGSSLRSEMAAYRSPQAAQRLLSQIANALDYVHDLGHLHGNLRPSNVLLAADNRPLLSDFEFGTPPNAEGVYVAPEQLAGGAIDHRVDIYALGVMLYEMVVGSPPEAGRVPSPRSANPSLSPELEKVILKAMAPQPTQRFDSAEAFRQALAKAAATMPPPAPQRPPTPAPVPVQPPPQQATPAAPAEVTYAAPKEESGSNWLNGCLGAILGALLVFIAIALVYLLFFKPDGPTDVPPTPPPGVPTLTSTTDLNVRSGPSEAYDVIGLMRQGQTAELIGMSPDGQWWTIRFPAVASQQGWVSAAYATVENAGNVPIVQPPPLPTTTAAPTSEATATIPPLPTATEPPAVFPTLPTEPTLPAMTLPAEQPTVTYP